MTILYHIPNIISILRILLVVPIVHQLVHGEWVNAFIMILIAGISDGVDGFLARHYQWQSKLGSYLDPFADKLLLIAVFVSLAYKEVIPDWLAVLVVLRDFIILLGAIIYQWLTRELRMMPIILSKINTVMQILFVLALLYHLSIDPVSEPILNILKYGVAVTTVLSGMLYVFYWSRYTVGYLADKQQYDKRAV